MALRTWMAMLFFIGICLTPVSKVATSSNLDGQPMPQFISQKSPFRYVITRNRISEGTRYPEGGAVRFRAVDVLLDEESFSEVRLRQLVKLLSKRFRDPSELLVNIYTNLEDVLTPEEDDVPASAPIDLTATPKHAWAFYIRNSQGERLDYHTKKSGDTFRTVQLSGTP